MRSRISFLYLQASQRAIGQSWSNQLVTGSRGWALHADVERGDGFAVNAALP